MSVRMFIFCLLLTGLVIAPIRSNPGESGRLGCLVLGTNTLTLPAGVNLSQGTWTVLYELNEASHQFVTFRVPSADNTNIEKEVLKKSAIAGTTETKC